MDEILGLKTKEILMCLLLCVIFYTIFKMLSNCCIKGKSCDGFSVGANIVSGPIAGNSKRYKNLISSDCIFNQDKCVPDRENQNNSDIAIDCNVSNKCPVWQRCPPGDNCCPKQNLKGKKSLINNRYYCYGDQTSGPTPTPTPGPCNNRFNGLGCYFNSARGKEESSDVCEGSYMFDIDVDPDGSYVNCHWTNYTNKSGKTSSAFKIYI